MHSISDMVRRPKAARGRANRFGGDWTESKLATLRKYLHAYTTALKKQPFEKWYVDGFAGTPLREAKSAHTPIFGQGSLFQVDTEEEPARLLEGSSLIALRCDPAFDRYVFIEKNSQRCAQLESLRNQFPQHSARIEVRRGDANQELRELCSGDWSRRRAVLFLDPFGTETQWTTLEAIAATKAIDLWVLFPLSGVNRLVTISGEIPDSWSRRLTQLFGTEKWQEELYSSENLPSLFGEESRTSKVSPEQIGQFFLRRLKGLFPHVAPSPRVLANSTNSPLYLFCFAAANPDAGGRLALKIANHILNKI
jgi:three-Cys-motif partner protein